MVWSSLQHTPWCHNHKFNATAILQNSTSRLYCLARAFPIIKGQGQGWGPFYTTNPEIPNPTSRFTHHKHQQNRPNKRTKPHATKNQRVDVLTEPCLLMCNAFLFGSAWFHPKVDPRIPVVIQGARKGKKLGATAENIGGPPEPTNQHFFS